MSALRAAFRVHGKVQGVCFRDFTQQYANEHGLSGWVRNTTCGNVEGEAQSSDKETLDKFFEHIEEGPEMSDVTKLEMRDMEPCDGEDDFAIRNREKSTFESGP